jgi:microcystin-dependent protein
MSQPFLGEIRQFPYTFSPAGFAYCSGQLISINENQALFAIIGGTYGGNWRTTMGLPDLRGTTVMQWGIGPGLHDRPYGNHGGDPMAILDHTQIPSHNHDMTVMQAAPTSVVDDGSGNYLSTSVVMNPELSGQLAYSSDSDALVTLAEEAISITGNGVGHENRQPFIAIPFCIALDGVFPARN